MVVDDATEIPTVRLDVLKDGQNVETITLENQAFFIFGRNQGGSFLRETVQLLHESISIRHAAFVLDVDQGLLLTDLSSQYGTFLNGNRLDANFPTRVAQKGDVVTFGASTRQYRVTVDYSKMLKAQERALRNLEKQMDQLADLSSDEANVDVKTFKSTLGVKREDTVHVSGLPYHF